MRTYKSGEKPQIGDTVILEDNSSTGWNSTLYSVQKGKTYTVIQVCEGSASTLVKIGLSYGDSCAMKASRFRLVQSVNAPTAQDPKLPKKYVVIDPDNFSIVGTAVSNKTLQELLERKLLVAPSKAFQVFVYSSTAKTKKPEVQFVNEAGSNLASAVGSHPQVLELDEENFKKV